MTLLQLKRPSQQVRRDVAEAMSAQKRAAAAAAAAAAWGALFRCMDPMWGIGLREDNPRVNDPCQWRRKKMVGEALSAVCEAIRESETGSVHPRPPLVGSALAPRMQEPQEFVSAAAEPLTAASARKGPPSEFSIYFSDAPAD